VKLIKGGLSRRGRKPPRWPRRFATRADMAKALRAAARELRGIAAELAKLDERRTRIADRLNQIAEVDEGGKLGPGVPPSVWRYNSAEMLAEHAEWLEKLARERTVILRPV
jgi:hypothetical protein